MLRKLPLATGFYGVIPNEGMACYVVFQARSPDGAVRGHAGARDHDQRIAVLRRRHYPAAADTTQQVPISRKGDARIHDASFTVPSTCLAPVILVHPNGLAMTYIALGGWRLS